MKKSLLFLVIILAGLTVTGQTPQGINYQTVVRNGDGDALPYTDIWLKVSILADAPDGTIVYSEVHPATTNGFGLVNLVIGQGTALSGNFGEIAWSAGQFYLETAINFDGGAGYQLMGVTQLLSVPFAKYADFSAGLKSMTTEERNALENPPAGMTIYNTTTNCLNYWSGSNWFETCGACTPQPSNAVAGPEQTINTADTVAQLAGNIPAVGTGLWTKVSGSGGYFEDSNDPKTKFHGKPCTVYRLRWSISTSCTTKHSYVYITFNAIPTVATAGDDMLLNDETTTVTLTGNTPVVGNGLWTVVNGTGGAFANPTSPTTTFTGLPCQTYTLRWTIATACSQTYDEMNVTFDPIPTAAIAGDDVVVNTDLTTISLAANTPLVGSGLWTVTGGEGGTFASATDPNTTFTGLPCQTYTLRWTIATACYASNDEMVVVFDAIPTVADAGNDIAITTSEVSVTLAANEPEIGDGLWEILSGEGGNFADAANPATLFTGQPCTTYLLAWTITTDCHLSTASITVTLYNTPTEANSGPDQLGLTGTWTTLAANIPQNGTGQWTILSGEGGTLTNPASPTTILLGQNLQHYILKWEISTNCATSSDTLNVAFGFVPFLKCGDNLFDSRDGQYYATVQIGEQCWMAENLAWLPSVSPSSEGSNSEPYYYIYGYQGNSTVEARQTSNFDTYGVLYNWIASLNACPTGWQTPLDSDFCTLATFIDQTVDCGIIGFTGINAGGKLKTTGTYEQGNGLWFEPNVGATNEYGFSGLPDGSRYTDGEFQSLGTGGHFWTTYAEVDNRYYWRLNSSDARINRNRNVGGHGLSVRCIKQENGTSNLQPLPPFNPSPQNGSINLSINVNLLWDCIDPDSDPLTYDVYFGTDESPTLVASGITEQTYAPTALEYSTTYYWKIVAHDDQGNNTEGEVWSFTSEDYWECGETITDIDGNVYNTLQIGNQCWMKENLKTTKYRNGTNITYPGSNITTWQNNTTGAYAWYNNDIAYKNTYGALYNWHAVNNSAALCPTGWHVPSDAEWTALTTYVSSQPDYLCNSNTSYIAKALAAKTNWNTHTGTCTVGNNLNANNATNFTALPGGYRVSNGTFASVGSDGDFWSSSESSAPGAWNRYLNYSIAVVNRSSNYKGYGFSVRCLRDN